MNRGTSALAALLGLGLSACSYFGTEPDANGARRVHEVAPRGALMDTAEANLVGLGYRCGNRQGDYEDESGQTRSAPHFLLCEQRPGTVSFRCENRDRVVVIPTDANVVRSVEVTRGPSCAQP